jgi:hypothetical protein
MTAKNEPKTIALEAEPGHFTVTGNNAAFRLTDAQVATIASSANTRFDAFALEMSKRLEEIAKTVSDSEASE